VSEPSAALFAFVFGQCGKDTFYSALGTSRFRIREAGNEYPSLFSHNKVNDIVDDFVRFGVLYGVEQSCTAIS